jgi:hypothetical protein
MLSGQYFDFADFTSPDYRDILTARAYHSIPLSPDWNFTALAPLSHSGDHYASPFSRMLSGVITEWAMTFDYDASMPHWIIHTSRRQSYWILDMARRLHAFRLKYTIRKSDTTTLHCIEFHFDYCHFFTSAEASIIIAHFSHYFDIGHGFGPTGPCNIIAFDRSPSSQTISLYAWLLRASYDAVSCRRQ